jgi:hypothetical protein
MKKLLTILLSFAFMQTYAQDFVKKTDGTIIKGETKSFDDNILTIQTTDNQTLSFKVDELSKIYISRKGFKMNNINLDNSIIETDDNGTTITLGKEAMNSERKQKNKSSAGSFGGGSSHSSTQSTSSESITSDDDAPKASVIFECNVCLNKGKLQLESQDGTASASWAFSADEGSAFPHKINIVANKTYEWSYHDKKNGWISGTFKLKTGETFINEIKP